MIFTKDYAKRPETREVEKALLQFMPQRLRLKKLKNYYIGKNDILFRQRKEGAPNLRLPHAYAGYVSNTLSSLMMQDGISYTGDERAQYIMPPELDMRLALDQSVYGKGISLVLRQNEGLALCSLCPESAFVAYSEQAKPSPLFGLIIRDNDISVYTKSEVIIYQRQDMSLKLVSAKFHGLKALPMIEYPNNGDEMCDFERAMNLIDAYDILASDRMNDRVQFADAMLVLTGVMGLCEEEGTSALTRLRSQRTLSLPDSESKAEWLVKNPTESDIEVLRQALSNDIHKFCGVPDFSKLNLGNKQSTTALKYQLFALRSQIRQKQAFYMQGVKRRLDIIGAYYGTNISAGFNKSSLERLIEDVQ